MPGSAVPGCVPGATRMHGDPGWGQPLAVWPGVLKPHWRCPSPALSLLCVGFLSRVREGPAGNPRPCLGAVPDPAEPRLATALPTLPHPGRGEVRAKPGDGVRRPGPASAILGSPGYELLTNPLERLVREPGCHQRGNRFSIRPKPESKQIQNQFRFRTKPVSIQNQNRFRSEPKLILDQFRSRNGSSPGPDLGPGVDQIWVSRRARFGSAGGPDLGQGLARFWVRSGPNLGPAPVP